MWRVIVECPRGHKWTVPIECKTCRNEHHEQVPPDPFATARPGRFRMWRETRRLRKGMKREGL